MPSMSPCEAEGNTCYPPKKFPIGYCILTVLGLLLIQTVFFAPQHENLSYRDFKTLLKAGKVVDITLGERTITGHLTTGGLETLLSQAPREALQKFSQGEQRFVTVQVDVPPSSRIWRPPGSSFRGGSRVTGWAPCCPGLSRPWCS